MDCQASTTRSYLERLERMLFDETIKPKALPLSLLREITNGFSDKQEIGEGGFAIVYEGKLGNGRVAVKKLFKTDKYNYEEKFTEEVRCLMKVKHTNIVRFLGYCSDTQGEMGEYEGRSVMAELQERLLCFEYVPRGNLHEYIKDESREWIKCYQIIKGICEGLHYLHQNRIVHRDLKPANILLNDNMVPKIADFGLSVCFDEKQSQPITSKLAGSLGYLAPEFLDGKITFKSDIYSLGVVIIEILTGEKGRPNVEDVLERWRNRLEKSQGDALLEQVRVCTEVAQECIDPNPAKRPVTQHIIRRLDDTESTDWCTETRVSSSTVEQTINVNECLKDDDITQDMFNEVAGEVVDEVKSMVVHDTPSSPEETEMDMPHDTGNSNSQEPSIVPAEVAYEISTSPVSNELIQVDPGEFRFPSMQKEVKSTLKIVNITHEQVAFKFMSLDTTAKYGGVLLPRSALELAVTRHAEEGAPPDVPRNEVVIVQNTVLNEDFMENNITGHMFRTLKGEIVHKVEQGSVHVRPFRPLLMQKIVIIVSMTCEKARSKAMTLAAGTTGVVSIGITGDGRNQLVVVGEGVDSVCLVVYLRKKLGHAQLLQVGDFVEVETQ